MDERLNAADRTTLHLWRIMNVAGWSLFSLASALFLRRGFEAGASLIRHSLLDVYDWTGYGQYALLVLVPSSVLCGCWIGSVIGGRVYWRPALVAGVAATMFASARGLVMFSVDTPHYTFIRVLNALFLVLCPVLAVVVVKRTAKGRPAVQSGPESQRP